MDRILRQTLELLKYLTCCLNMLFSNFVKFFSHSIENQYFVIQIYDIYANLDDVVRLSI